MKSSWNFVLVASDTFRRVPSLLCQSPSPPPCDFWIWLIGGKGGVIVLWSPNFWLSVEIVVLPLSIPLFGKVWKFVAYLVGDCLKCWFTKKQRIYPQIWGIYQGGRVCGMKEMVLKRHSLWNFSVIVTTDQYSAIELSSYTATLGSGAINLIFSYRHNWPI